MSNDLFESIKDNLGEYEQQICLYLNLEKTDDEIIKDFTDNNLLELEVINHDNQEDKQI